MRFALFLFAAALALASLQASAGVELSLKAEAMIAGPRVTLGDVVNFGEHEPAVRELAEMDLGGAPLPGYSDRFTRQEIERMVRARGIGGAVAWSGADAVRVERAVKGFNTQRVADSAEAYLRQLLSDSARRADLELAEPLPALQLPQGKVTLTPRAMLPAQALHRRTTVWVDISIDGAFFRSVTVPFRVQAWRPVLVALRDLPSGAIPQCDALQVREEDVAAFDSPPLAADCQLLQGRLKRALAQGTPLLKANMQAPVAVAQGDSVSLQLAEGAVVLESRAVAMVDGEIGQRINVRPSAGTETVLAEVIAPGVVRVNGR